MRNHRLIKVLGICAAALPWTGCAHPTAAPAQAYPPQQYQSYPYGYQPGQPIQPSPMVGVMPTAQPGAIPQGQIPTYPVMQQGAVPTYPVGYMGPAGYTGQPMAQPQPQPPIFGK